MSLSLYLIETKTRTDQEKAIIAAVKVFGVGYTPSERHIATRVIFPYEIDPTQKEIPTIDTLLKGNFETKGKFVLFHFSYPSSILGKESNDNGTYMLRMNFTGDTHLTMAAWTQLEILRYICQGYGDVSFKPEDMLMMQNHHETGGADVLHMSPFHLHVVDGGRIMVGPKEQKVTFFGYSQAFSTPYVVDPRWGMSDIEEHRKANEEGRQRANQEHLGHLNKAADILKEHYKNDIPLTIMVDAERIF